MKMHEFVESILFFRDGNKTFWEPESFPWVAHIEREWITIRKELEALLKHREEIPNFQDISENQKVLTDGDQWKTF